jgi:hypothetical protein
MGRCAEKPLQSDKVFIKIHITPYLMVSLFDIEAGWPGLMAIRSRWQAFFSTSAHSRKF